MCLNSSQISKCVESMKIIIDDREKETQLLKDRIEQFKCETIRRRLDFGDYSVECDLPDGRILSLENYVSIERKMDLSELAMCFTSDRTRFIKEFERAALHCAKIYLLVEKGSWEKAYAGIYKSHMSSKAMIGSLTTWLARYNCQLIFCDPGTSGKLIYDVLMHELKEVLKEYNEEGKI